MIVNSVTCNCGEMIIKSDNYIGKMRSKIVLFKDNRVFAVCKSCDKEVEVPLSIDSLGANPPLFVRDWKKE